MALISQFNRICPKLLTNNQNKGKTKWFLMTEKPATREKITIGEVSELLEWCTRQSALIAVLKLKFHSSQQKDGRFTAEIVYPNIGHLEKPADIKCDSYNWVISTLICPSFFGQSWGSVAWISFWERIFLGSVANLL